ncbi:MAG TPA: hypothetical protein VI248_22495, partial [Kineosporiaceae bacterium]
PGQAGRTYLEATLREGSAYCRAVTTVGVAFVEDVVTLASTAAARVLHETGDQPHRPAAASPGGGMPAPTTAPTSSQPPPQPAPPPAVVVLRGAVGDTTHGTLTVANRHPRARRVELTAPPLADETGAATGIVLEFDPARVTVPANGEHAVALSVALPADLVRAGATYRTTVNVAGGEQAQVAVAVVVSG